jgi:hypothetical protein
VKTGTRCAKVLLAYKESSSNQASVVLAAPHMHGPTLVALVIHLSPPHLLRSAGTA